MKNTLIVALFFITSALAGRQNLYYSTMEIESVAKALFDEWKSELDQYSNEKLRRASEKKLGQTRQRYSYLIGAMKRAETKINPVLVAFRD